LTRAFITKEEGNKGMTSVTDAVVRSAISLGEPVTRQKLVKAGQGGVMAAILPDGMRAVSTKIKEETAAGQLILPNDRVDVILIRKVPSRRGDQNNTEMRVSDTLLQNVRVLAIGQQIETKQGSKSSDINAKTATLALTPQQAEMLALGNSTGEITLSLRSIGDGGPKTGPSG
jgi:pilus assembly protein CpaB